MSNAITKKDEIILAVKSDYRLSYHQILGDIKAPTAARWADILSFFKPLFAKFIIKYDRKISPLLEKSITDMVCGNAVLKPAQMINVVEVLLGNSSNVALAFEHQPPAFKAALKLAMTRRFITEATLQRVINDNLQKFLAPIDERTSQEIYPTAPVFMRYLSRVYNESSFGYRSVNRQALYVLNPVLFNALNEACVGKEPRTISTCSELLPDGLQVYNASNDILAQFATIVQKLKSRKIVLSGCAPSIDDTNRMKTILRFPAMFEAPKVKGFIYVGLRSFLAYIVSFTYRILQIDDTKELIKVYTHWLLETPMSQTGFVSLYFPHLKFSSRRDYEQLNLYQLHVVLIELLCKYSRAQENSWISVDDLNEEILNGFHQIDPIEWLILSAPMPKNTITHSELTYENLYNCWHKQIVPAYLAHLAVAGMVEIAYRPEAVNTATPWDAVKFVRLTGVGKYAVGLESEECLEITTLKPKPLIVLEPGNLLVQILDPSAKAFLVKSFGDAVTSTLVKYNAGKFLANVTQLEDIDDNVRSLLDMSLLDKLPPFWAKAFEKVKANFNPLEKLSNRDYAIYRIKNQDSDIIKIIAEDPEIRRLVLLAEKHTIIVHRDNYKSLEVALNKYGYSLPATHWSYFY